MANRENMNAVDRAAAVSAAAGVMYDGLAGPQNGREACEAGESAEALLLDELALSLMKRGCPAKDAARYVQGMMEVFRARDVAVCAGAMGAEAAPASESTAEVLVRYESMTCEMLRGIVAAEQPRLEAKINLMARGKGDDDESLRKLAAKVGKSPAALSKMMLERQERFNLPKNQYNKSEAACESYRLGNKRRAAA